MRITDGILAAVVGLAAAIAPAHAAEVGALLETLRAVGPDGSGHREAAKAWSELARADAAQLPQMLAGLDGAGPLGANWIRTAIDAVAERQLERGGRLPAAELEKLILDRSHSSRARRLAYEWLLRVDPTANQRLIPGMIDDPCLELRRDAVARLVDQAAQVAKREQKAGALKLYQQALAAARDHDQIDLAAKRLREMGQKVDLARQLGYVVRWKLIGPFDNTGGKGLDAAYAPEQEVRFDATYAGSGGTVRWVDFVCRDDHATVDLNKGLVEKKEVVGYAAAEFIADRARDVELRTTSDNALKIWLNGAPVAVYPMYHAGAQTDQYVNRVAFRPGRNVILVKVGQNELTDSWARRWDFQLRVVDLGGAAVLSADQKDQKQ